MAGVVWKAIIPKEYHSAARAQGKLDDLLRDIAQEAHHQLQTYPPWQPWKNPPRTGLHAGGKRTGTLKAGWGAYKLESGRSVTLENKVRYSPYVQGPSGTQARALAARGWNRVDEVGREAVRKAVSRFRGY